MEYNNRSIKLELVNIDTFIIDIGNLVEVKNIQSKPHLNGQPAIIEDYDSQSLRYTLKLEDNSHIKVKLNNVYI